jgi:hypothetical protein
MNAKTEELTELIHACLDGRATDEEAARLNARLRVDAAARDLYLQSADTHSCLAVDESLWIESSSVAGASASKVQPMRQHWLTWRPLTAAAAGIVLGMLCTSMVFAYVAPSLGKGVTLLEEGFESHSVELRSDFPGETGVWGGGVARVVQGVDGVVPPEGRRMLRVEPDVASNLTYLDRIIDLSSLPLPAAGDVRYVEVTASFHAGAAGLRNRYTLRAAAFGEAPGSLRQLWLKVPWRELEERALAGAKRGLSTAADTTGWHKITVRVEAPPEARSLVISLAAGLFETPDLNTAHYIDEVFAHLVMTPGTTHPRHRRR